MGRGRAKAKQTNVARELKYNSGSPDLAALQAELGGSNFVPVEDDDDLEYDDPYAKYYEEDEEEAADDRD